MVLWVLSSFLWLRGVRWLLREVDFLGVLLGASQSRKQLSQVVGLLRELEETLMTGLVPDVTCWDRLKQLAKPWDRLAYESLTELKASGAAVLPTLRRLRALAEEQTCAWEDAQVKTAQAWMQALVCAFLVPIVGVALYVLLPTLQEKVGMWGVACGGALGLMAVGAVWMLQLADTARWGGLGLAQRSWLLSSFCAGERLLALVRLGVPPDLAWVKMGDFLHKETPDLARAWGGSIWEVPRAHPRGRAEEILISAGQSIRKTAQVSIMEGRPCLDRVESILYGLRSSMKAQIERELSLVGTHALKPLFLCVAPSILGLLFFALWLTGLDSLGSDFWGGHASF